eukprot:scaffold2373_cov239-Pinguiococcus_pyrenoidosus.AAC.9
MLKRENQPQASSITPPKYCRTSSRGIPRKCAQCGRRRRFDAEVQWCAKRNPAQTDEFPRFVAAKLAQLRLHE